MPKTISGGTVHKITTDIKKALSSDSKALTAWESLTPLARNEWICWVSAPKKSETRALHLERAMIELKEGKRRPCCWYGCIHRTDKEVSPSVTGVLSKQKRYSDL